jgi:chemotaxis protein MotB
MAGQANAAPVIIKRKKIIAADGHHGGAWKVAYADFVTAMMAFFLLMWLLNATTEKQRKGIADYFNPAIPVNRISAGGEGAFGGDSVFSEEVLAQAGNGASNLHPTEDNQARGETGAEAGDGATAEEERASLEQVERALLAQGGESMTMERALRHVVTRVTDEGLVIELFDLPDAPLFAGDGAEPMPVLHDLADIVRDALELVTNEVAVNGHVRSYPIVLAENPVWPLSSARAQAMRGMIESRGVHRARLQRVTGYADRRPVTADHAIERNNRIEIVVLRRNR